MLAGIALGLFVGLMFYLFSGNDLQQIVSPTNSDVNTVENPSSHIVKTDKVQSLDDQRSAYLDKVIEEKVTNMEEDNRPRFNYHVILPILDVEVPVARPPEWDKPKQQSSKKSEEKVEKKSAKQNTKAQYILQVSSHKNNDIALKMLKKMRTLGLNAYIKTASIKGETWHRVNIGPLEGAKEAKKTEAYLLEKGINPPLRRPFK